MLDHPCHLFRRDTACGDDEVALVLPVLIVHDHEKLAPCEGIKRVYHWIEGKVCARGGIAQDGVGGVAYDCMLLCHDLKTCRKARLLGLDVGQSDGGHGGAGEERGATGTIA